MNISDSTYYFIITFMENHLSTSWTLTILLVKGRRGSKIVRGISNVLFLLKFHAAIKLSIQYHNLV